MLDVFVYRANAFRCFHPAGFSSNGLMGIAHTQCWEPESLPRPQTKLYRLSERAVTQLLRFILHIKLMTLTQRFVCVPFPQESCRKCHVLWKEHVGKTCEQVLERDEIRLRVAL